MGVRLIEVKDSILREDEREFLFKVSATEQILHYQDLMIKDDVNVISTRKTIKEVKEI